MGTARKTITVYKPKGDWIRRKLKSDLTSSWTALAAINNFQPHNQAHKIPHKTG